MAIGINSGLFRATEDGGCLMQFRYYCLNSDDRIVLGDHLHAIDLDAAICAAYEACRDHPHFPSSRIEIWQGAARLYRSEHGCPTPAA